MMAVSVCELIAVDVHAHLGVCRRGVNPMQDEFMSGGGETVVRRAGLARTGLTIVSSLKALMPRGNAEVIAGNAETYEIVRKISALRQWVVVDPCKPETFVQAAELVACSECVGIKVHPVEHGYSITDHGRAIFEFAEKHMIPVLSHSGETNSRPEQFVAFANDFPSVRIILAHLGCSDDTDRTHHVRAVQQSKHGNLFVDTSSAGNVTPGLIEWSVRELGAGRILYGSDSPLYFAPMQRARIDYAEISDSDKRKILRENAITLFGLADIDL